MDTVLTSLSVDSSFFYQFFISAIFFIVAKFLFFEKLKSILLMREEKTSKLDGNADRIMQNAAQKAEKFRAELDATYVKAKQLVQDKNAQKLKEAAEMIQRAETLAEDQLKKNSLALAKELDSLQKSIDLEVDSLSAQLVNRITN
jgi:F-type H+-transporting ATPase subunit b